MVKNILFVCAWPLILPLMFIDGSSKNAPVFQKTRFGLTAFKPFTVKVVSGSIRLDGAPLRVGDRLDEDDIERIRMAKGACFVVAFQGKQESYCAAPNCPSDCRPVNKPMLISVGDRSDESDDDTDEEKPRNRP